MKNNKLYSVMFPIWFLLIYPLTWVIILPVNLLIDMIVLMAGFKYYKVSNAYDTFKKVLLKVWLFGLLANIIASVVLFLPIGGTNSLYNSFKSGIVWDPYANVVSIILLVITVILAMLLIYTFNYKISFKKVGLDKKKAKMLAATMAIFTAPWILLFPTKLVYDNSTLNVQKVEMSTDQVSNALNDLDLSAYIQNGVFDSESLKLSINCNINTDDESQVLKYKNLFESNSTDAVLSTNADKIFNKVSYVEDVVFKISNDKTYEFSRTN